MLTETPLADGRPAPSPHHGLAARRAMTEAIISFRSGAVRQELETDNPAIGKHDVAVLDAVAAARGDDAGQVSDARVMPGGRRQPVAFRARTLARAGRDFLAIVAIAHARVIGVPVNKDEMAEEIRHAVVISRHCRA